MAVNYVGFLYIFVFICMFNITTALQTYTTHIQKYRHFTSIDNQLFPCTIYGTALINSLIINGHINVCSLHRNARLVPIIKRNIATSNPNNTSTNNIRTSTTRDQRNEMNFKLCAPDHRTECHSVLLVLKKEILSFETFTSYVYVFSTINTSGCNDPPDHHHHQRRRRIRRLRSITMHCSVSPNH